MEVARIDQLWYGIHNYCISYRIFVKVGHKMKGKVVLVGCGGLALGALAGAACALLYRKKDLISALYVDEEKSDGDNDYPEPDGEPNVFCGGPGDEPVSKAKKCGCGAKCLCHDGTDNGL